MFQENLVSIRYLGKGNIRGHIIRMSNLALNKALKVGSLRNYSCTYVLFFFQRNSVILGIITIAED